MVTNADRLPRILAQGDFFDPRKVVENGGKRWKVVDPRSSAKRDTSPLIPRRRGGGASNGDEVGLIGGELMDDGLTAATKKERTSDRSGWFRMVPDGFGNG